MMYLEFVLVGIPVSNQSDNKTILAAWRAAIRSEAQKVWTLPPMQKELKAVIINFFDSPKPPLDLDNMSKPILDSLEGLVYANDRQVRQVEFTHVRIDSVFRIIGVSKLIVTSVQAGNQFVYVRIEDLVDPFPLPK
jgi:crossover junction endodeoxyribonuclease RusA